MYYKQFLCLSRLYTLFLKRRFYHFGENSVIKPFLNSWGEEYISIGDNVNIGAFSRISVTWKWCRRECSHRAIRLKIGNNVSIGNNAFIGANNNIEIGNRVILSSYVFIADHEHGFNPDEDLDGQFLSVGGHVKIGDNVFIGTKACILPNVTVGEHAVIGAASVVTRNVPPYTIVAGNPARIIRRLQCSKESFFI